MSRKAEFLKYLDEVIPEDGHLFEFDISFQTQWHGYTKMPVVGLTSENMMSIGATTYQPVTVDGTRCRIGFEGSL